MRLAQLDKMLMCCLALFTLFHLFALTSGVHCQPAQALLYDDFEKGQSVWFVLGMGKVTLAKGDSRSGQTALSFSYAKGIAVAVMPTAPLPGARSVSFWVKPSSTTVLLSAMQENDGSRYAAAFCVIGGKWQLVQLSVDDFSLMPDTQDENGRLDTEQASMLGLADAIMLFQPGGVAQERTILIDDLLVSTSEVAARLRSIEVDGTKLQLIDDFESTTLFWAPVIMAPGRFDLNTSADMSVELGAARHGNGALSIRYELQPNSIPALMTLLTRGIAGARSFIISLKASEPTGIVIALGENDGSRYQTFVYVPAGDWRDIAISVDDFQLAEDTKDENERLDLNQVQFVVLADAGGLFADLIPRLRGKRQLWVDRVALSSAEVTMTQGIAEDKDGLIIWLDNFESDAMRWVPLEAMLQPIFNLDIATRVTVRREEHLPEEAQGRYHLRIDYEVPANGVIGMAHFVTLARTALLKHASALRMWIRPKEAISLLVVLQERGGGRYQRQVDLQGGKWQRVDLPLSDFIPSPDTRDENERLDLDQLLALALVDMNVFAGGPVQNTVFIDGV
ncbi:MAG: hypothetical protein RMK18_09685, partial [Armatimonadota bacterium]|nr:CIA30 family protein [Armatimonadota bacterium]MDW8026115.1 hypothetical protein [Armatimonadota bacterium]